MLMRCQFFNALKGTPSSTNALKTFLEWVLRDIVVSACPGINQGVHDTVLH